MFQQRLSSLTEEHFMTASALAFAPTLAVVDGQATTLSTDVARHFGKRHDDVLRSIRGLIVQMPEGHLRNFAEASVEVEQPNGGKATYPAYRLTRDGFTLLAMGFTGKKALAFKLAYIDAFNQMEAALLQQSLPTTITPAQQQHLKELVDLVVESGKQKSHAETWARLHRKFGVPRYIELPAAQFVSACLYLKSKIDQPSIAALIRKHLPAQIETLDLSGGPAAQAAHEAAMQYIDNLRNGQQARWDLPPEVLQGLVLDALMGQRFIVSFGYRQGMSIKPIARDAYILPASQWAKAIESGDAHLPPEELARLANVCTQRMARALQRRLPPSQPPALA
ncbi:hypothetical protein EII18_08450 [Comamonadaceae bacterium OH3737_COT-264]|nr:hypothetical protein EII18_08450 [Comamonadaceae bacterium OH3737_COT-264]